MEKLLIIVITVSAAELIMSLIPTPTNRIVCLLWRRNRLVAWVSEVAVRLMVAGAIMALIGLLYQ